MQKDTRNIRLSNTEPAFAAVIRKCLDELIFSSTYLHAEHMFFAIRSPWRLLASTKSDPPSAILSFPLRTLADHKTKLLVERNHLRRESENIPGMRGPLKLNWRIGVVQPPSEKENQKHSKEKQLTPKEDMVRC